MRRITFLAAVTFLWVSGCDSADPAAAPALEHAASAGPSLKVQQFCGHCHAFPQPETFAREEWRAEVAQGFRFYEAAENLKLDPPTEDEVVAFYEARAPESMPQPQGTQRESGNRFIPLPADTQPSAMSVSGLTQVGSPADLWACDMRTGAIYRSTTDSVGQLSEVARPVELSNPARLNLVDLNADGHREVLVSDLGSFFPQDHLNGSIWQLEPDNEWKATPVLQGIARVCDVQAGDLDGDQDLDLVVAEFGWRRAGRVLILWNPGNMQYENWKQQVLDNRHGAIDVPIVDLNGDGRLDIIVVLSQEHELVLAYLNQGEGQFEQKTIFTANEPSFGSSGIQVIDFDKDGDLDVVHTNGDSFDSSFVKPFHGIRWLENQGKFPFTTHEITHMAGVHRAIAGDLDLDGDLDLAAVSLLPPSVSKRWSGLPSIVWLERKEQDFITHVVETDTADHATCDLLDVDSDGDLDLVTANFRWQEETGPPVTWYLNQGADRQTAHSR